MNNIIAVIQARVAATRLPGKVLLDLKGKTVLERVIERVKPSKLINEIIVATTINKEDLVIVTLCADIGIRIFCGSDSDVLDRYYQAARMFGTANIVRITADCPLIDSDIIDEVLTLHLQKNADYTSNTIKPTYPDGEDAEVFTFEALQKTWKNAKLSSEREHVTPYMIKNPGTFKLASLEGKENLSQKRWTLDHIEDYEFLKTIYKKLYPRNNLFKMGDILKFLADNPEVERINQDIPRNEGYLKSLREDATVCPDRFTAEGCDIE